MIDLAWLGLIIPAAYYLISTFFLCFPNILHKRQRYRYQPFNELIDSNLQFCIGHRGGSWQAPENTIQVFKKNEPLSHMFQLDVCLTLDKQLLVHHDHSLLRTCGVDKEIAELNASEIPPMKSVIIPMAGESMQTSKNRLPLLKEVFEAFPNQPMNIELKTPSTEAISEFNRLVTQFNRQDYTVWGIASSMNEQLREANPDVVNFYSAGETLKIFLLFITGLLPFVCIRQGVLDIPYATKGLYQFVMKMIDSNCRKCLFAFIFGILNLFNCLSRLFIPHLKKRGILTFYFIINEEQDFQSAINSGCSGIMTDRVSLLNKFLKKELLYKEEEASFAKKIKETNELIE